MNNFSKNCSIFLLAIFTLTSSCKGQIKNSENQNSAVNTLHFTSKNIKLIPTQGSSIHQNVHCILEAKDGTFWFGTTGEGVYHFDGKEFIQFTEKDGLNNNKVWSVLEDKSGNIWFGTDDGISIYNGKNIEKVTIAVQSSAGFGMPIPIAGKNEVWTLMMDKKGIIWLGTSQGLYCYDGHYFTRFLDRADVKNNQQLKLKSVQSLLEDRKGNLWIGSGPVTGEGVVFFDGKMLTGFNPNGDEWIRYIVEDTSGKIWFSGRNNGVFFYDGKTFKIFTEKKNIGSAILADKKGNIWFDGGEKLSTVENINGIWRYDGSTFFNFNNKNEFGTYSAWGALEDSKKNIWFGTRNMGLYRYDGKVFTRLSK